AYQLGCASLGIPSQELLEVSAAGVLETGDEVLDCRRLAIVALEVEVHALAETLPPQQRLEHAHHFGALVVDGGRVEVVDLDVAPRTDGMGERPRVLGKLRGLEIAHVAYALDRGGALV